MVNMDYSARIGRVSMLINAIKTGCVIQGCFNKTTTYCFLFIQAFIFSDAVYAEESKLKLSGDYFLFGLGSPDEIEGQDSIVASGIARVTANYSFADLRTDNANELQLRVDHKHGLTDDVPLDFVMKNLGGFSIIQPAFSDIGLRLTNLYWRKEFNQKNTELMVGFLDSTDYIDTYALGNPYGGFSNLQFSTGAGTIAIPDESTLGLTLRHITSDNYYALMSFSDAKADSTHPFEGLDNVVNENQYFKSLEIGWVTSKNEFYLRNLHLTLWHSDGKGQTDSENYGANVSAIYMTGNWMPFFRAGVAEGTESLYRSSVTFGTGYTGFSENSTLGLAFGWAEPNAPLEFDEVINAEMYYRVQMGHFSFTPNVQFVRELPWNVEENEAWIFGLRARVQF
ncbi:carbohydrate porin [Vibrio jasicida]|uniref:carbohydrate porin n=1 Tax=Vibrio jasicida TaxID=766224 RepID=UPI0040685A42